MKDKTFSSSLIRYFLFFLMVVFLILIGLWIIAVPENKIKDAVENPTSRNSPGAELSGLRKGLFYNFKADRITFKRMGQELLYIEDASVNINPFYLFLLKLDFSFKGKIRDGVISGNTVISRNKKLFNIKLDNADIRDIPYLKNIGLKGTGILNAQFVIKDLAGELKFSIDNAVFEGAVFSDITVPMEIFDKIKGFVKTEGDVIKVESLSLEGEGIYGRVKGTIKNNSADLTLEIMPEASAGDKFPALIFLDRYKVSPGYYLIPLKTKFKI